MATIELDLDTLKTHIGRRQTATDVVTTTPANLLRLAFARPEPEFKDGDVLPKTNGSLGLGLGGSAATAFTGPLLGVRGVSSRMRRSLFPAMASGGSGCDESMVSGSSHNSWN